MNEPAMIPRERDTRVLGARGAFDHPVQSPVPLRCAVPMIGVDEILARSQSALDESRRRLDLAFSGRRLLTQQNRNA